MGRVVDWLKGKSKLLVAVFVAAIMGGATSAVVLAAIPDSGGVIHACYRTNGALRIIDSSLANCNANETGLNWSQGGSGNSYVSFNDDGTINAAYSTGVTSIKIVPSTIPDAQPADGYKICFNMSTTPRWGTSNGGGYMLVSSSSVSSEVAQITQVCGSGYNALDDNHRGFVADGGQPLSKLRYIFWN